MYVDRINGDDQNTGTFLSPFKTLKKASENAGSGSIIHFVQGHNNSEGIHEESQSILLDKRVVIELNNGPVIVQ